MTCWRAALAWLVSVLMGIGGLRATAAVPSSYSNAVAVCAHNRLVRMASHA